MTQEVQPLTWSKRTNIEEHQQFFSKINEIIGNLAPTVDEAEQAIAQATAAIASANDAVATANTASAAASAAASQAQTAASTVAGYDGRLTAAEGDIDVLQAADQTITGDITALQTRMTAAESKNTQQDSAISALQTADTDNVKITGTHAIGNYAVTLTGNQDVAGIKYMLSGPKGKDNFNDVTKPGSEVIHMSGGLAICDKNNIRVCGLYPQLWPDGTVHVYLTIQNKNGTTKYIVLGVGE